MDIFAYATRNKLRFPSPRGELTVEQLWDMPLEHVTGFDLNSVAKETNRQLLDVSESFVQVTANSRREELSTKLDVVKAVIEYKQDQLAEARNRAENRQQRERLKEVLHEKENAELAKLSPAQIKAKLKKLED